MQIVVRKFIDGDEEAFRLLNEEWIVPLFGLEDADRKILGDPQTHILAHAGQIYMALDGEKRVGTCALVKMGEGEYEVAKMGVSSELRGRGIGRLLLEFILADARKIGAKRLYIESNSTLKSALHLYESVGFQHLPPGQGHPHFARGNIFMELWLDEKPRVTP